MLFEKVVTTTPLISYDVTSQICIVGGVIIAITIIASVVDKFDGGSAFCLIAGMLIVFGGWYGHKTTEDKVSDKQIPLSTISDKIKVEGDKVIIEPLDTDKDNNKYHFSRSTSGKYPQSYEKNIFKFETDDYYEASYLVAEDGGKIKLNEEDTKFLKETRGEING